MLSTNWNCLHVGNRVLFKTTLSHSLHPIITKNRFRALHITEHNEFNFFRLISAKYIFIFGWWLLFGGGSYRLCSYVASLYFWLTHDRDSMRCGVYFNDIFAGSRHVFLCCVYMSRRTTHPVVGTTIAGLRHEFIIICQSCSSSLVAGSISHNTGTHYGIVSGINWNRA